MSIKTYSIASSSNPDKPNEDSSRSSFTSSIVGKSSPSVSLICFRYGADKRCNNGFEWAVINDALIGSSPKVFGSALYIPA